MPDSGDLPGDSAGDQEPSGLLRSEHARLRAGQGRPMDDKEIMLNNACADLLSLKRWEAFPSRLLADGRPGEWVAAPEFCGRVGVNADGLRPSVFVTWLPDPRAREGYVLILFYDDESAWSMAALYNRACLPGASVDPTLRPSGFPLSAPAAPLLPPVPQAPEKPA